MRFIRGAHNLKHAIQKTVVTIGNFDGLHLGHQSVLSELRAIADKLSVKTTLVTFEPHPATYFARNQNGCRLSTLREKIEILSHFKIDQCVCLTFNHKLANLSPSEFVTEIIQKGLNPSHLLIGHDFRFGKKRAGDYLFLKECTKKAEFTLSEASVYTDANHIRLSSSQIRQALTSGLLEAVAIALGRPYSVTAKVQKGSAIGRTWGYPTANLRIKSTQCHLPYGIYVVEVMTPEGCWHEGIASFGVRPTLATGSAPLLECHLLKGEHQLYGQRLIVRFLKKIREEIQFDTIEQLKNAIANDCEQARAFFKNISETDEVMTNE